MSDRPEPVLVKICGIRTPEDLNAAEGADLIGVVIDVPASPRTRTLVQARSLFQRAEGRFQRVAVVVGARAPVIRRVLEEAGPDLVQLHGPVPRDLRPEERERLVPSLALPEKGAAGSQLPDLPERSADFPLLHLDTAGGPLPGGTGRRSDWDLASELVRSNAPRRFLLGGGLSPDNVASALREVRPCGIDVSSGVESRPGVKSRAKVEQLLAAVRAVQERAR